MQEAFRVWLRPMGYEWRVCVDGLESAQWLLARLREAFGFQSREGIRQESRSRLCTFQVPYDPPYSYSKLQSLLAAIPAVRLMSDLGFNGTARDELSPAEFYSRRCCDVLPEDADSI